MNTLTELSPQMIMASGLKRISALADEHGITSPQVLDACERWGSILDDVNHPDGTCRHCGEAVTFFSEMQVYYHVETKSKHCRTHAGAEATYTESEKEQVLARLTPTKGFASGTLPQKPLKKK